MKLTHAQLHPDFVQHTTTRERRIKRALVKMHGIRQYKKMRRLGVYGFV